MSRVVVLADIGNTCIKTVFVIDNTMTEAMTLPTKIQHTADTLGLSLVQLLSLHGVSPESVTGAVLCSVVPDIASLFREACRKYLKISPWTFPEDFSLDIENGYKNPAEVGADRLLAAWTVRHLYPEPASLISIDFGTATTFDCISGNTYLGGLICPGLYSSRTALAVNTAKLPRISLEMDTREICIGDNTVTSMTHGFLFGFAAMTEGLCDRLKKQLPPSVFVVGTGGVARDLEKICSAFDVVHPNLLQEGLYLIWQWQKQHH